MKAIMLFGAAYIIESILFACIVIHCPFVLSSVILLGIVITMIFLTVVINMSVWEWKETRDECDAELTYAEFENLYGIMPEKFKLREDDVKYNYATTDPYPGYKTKRVYFKTYLDYCKYKKFYIQYNKAAKEAKRQEQPKEFIDSVQRDLKNRKSN